MCQVAFFAAAAFCALDYNVDRLAENHVITARRGDRGVFDKPGGRSVRADSL